MSFEPAEHGFVNLPAGSTLLSGNLFVPPTSTGLVIFVHGSGSSRFSPRNRQVAKALQENGFSTLLFDLLTPDEEAEDMSGGKFRFDIGLLSRRLIYVTDWLKVNPETQHLKLGYFGASTGAAAALKAAAMRTEVIKAVVSRGGRPDLAGAELSHVKAPVLLIVGGEDHVVVDINRRALSEITAEKTMALVPGATHLFEEPGALEQVTRLAVDWFTRYL